MTLKEIKAELKKLHARQDRAYHIIELRRKRIDRLRKEQEKIEQELITNGTVTVCKPGASGIAKNNKPVNNGPSIATLLGRLSLEEKLAMVELLNKEK